MRKTRRKPTETAAAESVAEPAPVAADAVLCSRGDGEPATARGVGNAPVCANHARAAKKAGLNVNEL